MSTAYLAAEPLFDVRRQVEYEVVLSSGKTVLLHPACHRIWLEECEPDTTPPATP